MLTVYQTRTIEGSKQQSLQTDVRHTCHFFFSFSSVTAVEQKIILLKIGTIREYANNYVVMSTWKTISVLTVIPIYNISLEWRRLLQQFIYGRTNIMLLWVPITTTYRMFIHFFFFFTKCHHNKFLQLHYYAHNVLRKRDH